MREHILEPRCKAPLGTDVGEILAIHMGPAAGAEQTQRKTRKLNVHKEVVNAGNQRDQIQQPIAAGLRHDLGGLELNFGILIFGGLREIVDNRLRGFTIETLQAIHNNHGRAVGECIQGHTLVLSHASPPDMLVDQSNLQIELDDRPANKKLHSVVVVNQSMHVEIAADAILHIAHRGSKRTARVRILGHLAADKVLLRRGLFEHQEAVLHNFFGTHDFAQLLKHKHRRRQHLAVQRSAAGRKRRDPHPGELVGIGGIHLFQQRNHQLARLVREPGLLDHEPTHAQEAAQNVLGVVCLFQQRPHRREINKR
eukprot:comp22469_c0_seq1/m.55479 comp22469_c0_seq1/g.55479  ORF comp22469_c0_seq1/g.55479 comp22469_c0_seq1/m.55479 type:complete len:311 (+) comp22469_c0_seq1:1274-2206(+)